MVDWDFDVLAEFGELGYLAHLSLPLYVEGFEVKGKKKEGKKRKRCAGRSKLDM